MQIRWIHITSFELN